MKAPVDEAGHALCEYCARGHDYQCTPCGQWLKPGVAMWGCVDCFFFVCAGCFVHARANGGSFEPAPLPSTEEIKKCEKEQTENRRISLVRSLAGGRFDLSPLLHFGNLRRLQVASPEIKAKVDRLFRRRTTTGDLMPLADPYDYYARAVLLHADAAVAALSDPQLQERCLHEARTALLAAVEATSPSVGSTASSGTPVSASRSGGDPRIWYLLGLVQCDLGDFAEARRIYRQALARLPAGAFAAPIHYNLALVHAVQIGPAARAAALGELREFRRICRSIRGGAAAPSHQTACELCGAMQRRL